MPVYIRQGSGWSKLKELNVRQGSGWARVSRAYIRQGAGWSLVFRRAFEVNHLITSTTYDFKLRDFLISQGWDEATPVNVTITVVGGIYLAATSTSEYAFDTQSGYPEGSSLTLINNGFIAGRGGAGGAGSTAQSRPPPGGDGQNGGVALRAQHAITIRNFGTVAGGGGGGGGGGGSYSSIGGGSAAAGGGGGGARSVGDGGASGGPVWRSSSWNSFNNISNIARIAAQAGSNATLWERGFGGDRGVHQFFTQGRAFTVTGGFGGNGGGWGQHGQPGTRGDAPSSSTTRRRSSGGSGGAPGAAVNGNSFITWEIPGSRLGQLL